MPCTTNTNNATDNTQLQCKSYISSACIINADPITFLGLPEGSTQQEVNNALVLSLMAALNRISQLENQLNENENL